MNFATIEYLVFLAIVWALYLKLPLRGQNLLLLAASYFFYGSWDWRFLSLIFASTIIDFSVGLALAATNDSGKRRLALFVSVAANLLILGSFKYFGFFVESAVVALQSLGYSVHQPTLNIVLPVGISFYTFQTMSYTIDLYRGRIGVMRDLVTFALFVAFFPQLVAGPIERASHLLPLLSRKRQFCSEQVSRGLFLILLGLMKKIALADGLSHLVDAVYGTSEVMSGPDILIATYAFAFQILCDFSAYTDIGRGSAKLFGIDLMENFHAPYLSTGPGEFWQRWHISLSTWLRDYLYIPLGGNRSGGWLTYRNLMITMVLGGLWHGAAWNFVLWGVYQGVLLCVFRAIRGGRKRTLPKSLWDWIRHLILAFAFFQLVCYGWLLFRAGSLEQIAHLTYQLGHFDVTAPLRIPRPPLSTLAGLCLLFAFEISTYVTNNGAFYRHWPPFLRGMLVGTILIILVLGLNNGASSFIYFQF